MLALMIVPLLACTDPHERCLSQDPHLSTPATAHVGKQHAPKERLH